MRQGRERHLLGLYQDHRPMEATTAECPIHQDGSPRERGKSGKWLRGQKKFMDHPNDSVEATVTRQQESIPKFACACCKDPRRFNTEKGLLAHAASKRYSCAYCGNRFRDTAELERHQHALHLRRQYWSCSALRDHELPFVRYSTLEGEADTCGFCGVDFPRSGEDEVGNPVLTDENWDMRARHLQETHRLGKCNSTKKFYLVDQFHQYLKHSHAGTHGIWTAIIEKACRISNVNED